MKDGRDFGARFSRGPSLGKPFREPVPPTQQSWFCYLQRSAQFADSVLGQPQEEEGCEKKRWQRGSASSRKTDRGNASSSPTDAAAEGEGPFEETRLGNHSRIELSRVVRRVEGLPALWPLTPLCSGLLPEFPIDLVKKLAKLGIQKKIGDTSHRYLLFIDVVFF